MMNFWDFFSAKIRYGESVFPCCFRVSKVTEFAQFTGQQWRTLKRQSLKAEENEEISLSNRCRSTFGWKVQPPTFTPSHWKDPFVPVFWKVVPLYFRHCLCSLRDLQINCFSQSSAFWAKCPSKVGGFAIWVRISICLDQTGGISFECTQHKWISGFHALIGTRFWIGLSTVITQKVIGDKREFSIAFHPFQSNQRIDAAVANKFRTVIRRFKHTGVRAMTGSGRPESDAYPNLPEIPTGVIPFPLSRWPTSLQRQRLFQMGSTNWNWKGGVGDTFESTSHTGCVCDNSRWSQNSPNQSRSYS
jgi:hypothetical protein